MVNKYFIALLFLLARPDSRGQGAGDFLSFKQTSTSLIILGTKGTLTVQVPAEGIFKIQTVPAGTSASADSSYTIVPNPFTTLPPVTETAGSLSIRVNKSALEITKKPLRVALRSGTEIKIRENGGITATRDSIRFAFDIDPKDVFHGAGARPFGPDLNRKAFDFYNTAELAYYDQLTGLSQSFNVPFIISSHRYGVLFDSNRPGSIRMYVGAVDSTRLTVEAASTGSWTYYLIDGDNNDEILEKYTLLTGHQPLPPRWALGYIQSKAGYENESDATIAISKMLDQGFPVDALALDPHWYGGQGNRGSFEWDQGKWPQAVDMVRRLREKGVRTILSNDPYVTTQTPQYRNAESLSLFATQTGGRNTFVQDIPGGEAALLDIFNPATRSWLGSRYKKRIDEGIEGWSSDQNEPEYDFREASFATGNAFQMHNLYPLLWSQALHDLYRQNYPGKRLFHLTRSGWTGAQRFGALPWSGAVARYWAGLKTQIPIMVQSGMSGLAYMHSAAGGFVTMSDKPEKDEELDLRWLQMATFSPMLRVDGGRSNVEPFNLNEPFYSVVKKYMQIRYQLLPYLYSLAWRNTVSGRPICMPLDYFEPDKALGNVADQYFFGENLLVAPVLLHGMPSRKVVLPEGKWFDFWTNSIQNAQAAYPHLTVDHIPVYARAGAFVPMATSGSMRSTEGYRSDSLTVKFFQDVSAPSSAFTFFHDDGTDPATLENGKFELIDLSGNVSESNIQISLMRKQSHSQALAQRVMLFEIENVTSPPLSVTLGGHPLPVVYLRSEFQSEMAYYDLANRQLMIRTNWQCQNPLNLSIVRDGLTVVTGTEPRENKNSILVFPNPLPAGKTLAVHYTTPETGDYTLEICNASGAILLQKQLGKYAKGQTVRAEIDVHQLHGLCILRLGNAEGKFYSRKILVE
nr:TIM-barrel domain-containing protein [uncultured Dyadobacter sp.]